MLVNLNIGTVILAVCVWAVECSTVKKAETKNSQDNERLKRQSPFHYEAIPFQAVQPAPVATPAPQPPQQQQSFPLLGALVSNVPGLNGITSTLTTLLPLGNLGNLGNLGGLGGLGGLGNLGGLGGLGGLGNLGALGGLTNLGGLGNLPAVGNLGGLLPGLAGLPGLPGTTPRCPLTQRLNCRCEDLLPLPPPVQPAPARSSVGLEILQQNVKFDFKGDKEISARLSNGLLLYQRSGIAKIANNKSSKVIQGFYSLQIKDNKYLTIYYTINDLDYTVKADVTEEPPQNDLVESTAAADTAAATAAKF